MPDLKTQSGYSLIEVVMVILIISILAAVAMKSMGGVVEDSRFEETRREMDELSYALVGNPALVSGGVRSDYGYVGDIGALPTDWDALVVNPGLGTWQGPYISDKFAAGAADNTFKLDGWGRLYSTPNSHRFSSTGSGETITRDLAGSAADLLYNSVTVTVTDLDFTPPGTTYRDSVRLLLTYPNGAGGLATDSRTPTANGLAVFDSIPIGIHSLRAVFLNTYDTLQRLVNVDPGRDYFTDMQYFADIWRPDTTGGGGGGLEVVDGSDTLTTANCFKLRFWITNGTGAAITVSALTLTWSGATAYYEDVAWDDNTVRSGSPALGSGDMASFGSARTINDGESVQIRIEEFHGNPGGGGPPVSMSNVDFTVTLSDGSTFTFTADLCI